MEIIRGTDLERHVWKFSSIGDYGNKPIKIFCDWYVYQVRDSKRHGWKNKESYSRITQRDNTIKRNELPTPQDVLDEVNSRINELVQIGWDYK